TCSGRGSTLARIAPSSRNLRGLRRSGLARRLRRRLDGGGALPTTVRCRGASSSPGRDDPRTTSLGGPRILQQLPQMLRTEILDVVLVADLDCDGLNGRLAADVTHQRDRFQRASPFVGPIVPDARTTTSEPVQAVQSNVACTAWRSETSNAISGRSTSSLVLLAISPAFQMKPPGFTIRTLFSTPVTGFRSGSIWAEPAPFTL